MNTDKKMDKEFLDTTTMVQEDNRFEMADLFRKVTDYLKANGLRFAETELAGVLARIAELLPIDQEEALLLPIVFSCNSVSDVERHYNIPKMDMLYYVKAINRLWYDGLIQYSPVRMAWSIDNHIIDAVLHKDTRQLCDYDHMNLQELAKRVESCMPTEYDMRDMVVMKKERFSHIADRVFHSRNELAFLLDGLASEGDEVEGKYYIELGLIMIDAAAFHNNLFSNSQLRRMVKRMTGEDYPDKDWVKKFINFFYNIHAIDFDQDDPNGKEGHFCHMEYPFANARGLKIRREMSYKEFQEREKAKEESEGNIFKAIAGADSQRDGKDGAASLEQKKWSEIEAKRLYYNEAENEQVTRLADLYDNARMQQVIERLAQRKRGKGFISLFYGAPGTGKTETCYQLALQSHRDIYSLDVSQIRTKWFGESESNLKAAFQEYAGKVKAAQEAGQPVPILLLNEADSIIGKRVNSPRGAEQANNAMQNILLQEFEKMEGIVICTTNLAGNMDAAFERRFLFKVEFHRPDAKVRAQIWQDKVEGLSTEDAQVLGEEYDFSGGEIDNIAKKADTDFILYQKVPSLESLKSLADEEHIGSAKKEVRRIGFTA